MRTLHHANDELAAAGYVRSSSLSVLLDRIILLCRTAPGCLLASFANTHHIFANLSLILCLGVFAGVSTTKSFYQFVDFGNLAFKYIH